MTDVEITDDPAVIIERLGGNKGAAEFFGVSKGAVSQWLVNGIPKDKITILKLSRPDVLGLPQQTARKRRHPITATPP